MRVVFRADASLDIGTGHVMRCATLAQALAQAGHECSFISRDLPGNLIARTRALGFATHALPPPTTALFHPDADGPPHAAWAGVPQAVDAAQSAAVLAAGCDWLVLDHYAFDARWTRAARPAGARVLVLDDLADRVHDCDLLLDQNLGHGSADYDSLVPPQSERLIGPAYALLRPQFAQARAGALAARKSRQKEINHLLIAMGGIDAQNVTSALIRMLSLAPPSDLKHVTVVMGAQAPGLEDVRIALKSFHTPYDLCIDSQEIAFLMSRADLAIGGAGVTALERCCLGLPSLIIIMAENQHRAARVMESAGVARTLADISNQTQAGAQSIDLQNALSALRPSVMSEMQSACAAVTDGGGTNRVSKAMSSELEGK